MDNDNVYMHPTDNFFSIGQQPATQVQDEEKATNEVLAQTPLLEEVVKHFDEKIAFYASIDSIPLNIESDSETFRRAYEANKLTRENLKQERDYIIARVKSVKR